MAALSTDQRFVVLLLIAVFSGAWLSSGTNAQAFTREDRGSILKFMDVLMNFLDADVVDNATSTESLNTASTTTIDDGNSTTLATTDINTAPGNTTESTSSTESNEVTTGSNEVTTESNEVTSERTTLIASETTLSTTTPSSIITPTQGRAAPRRICFKRVCYKFMGDKGYIV